MSELAGTVHWAVVPYAPAAPHRLYVGTDHEPLQDISTRQLLANARAGGDATFTFLVPGKARPVLVLNDPPERLHDEVTALRLCRFSKLTASQQGTVREQRDPTLFHLPIDRFDLPEENAAIISALVRVNISAIDPQSRGRLNPEEMRVLGERVIRFYGFDTRLLVEERLRNLAARYHREP